MKKEAAKIIEEKTRKAEKNMKRTMDDYKNFAIKGNVVDLAIGVVIGSAFTNIVNALVNSTIMPIISVLTNRVDLSTLFIALNGKSYASSAAAKAAGAITLDYGLLLNALLNFFIVSFTLFIVVKNINKMKKKSEDNAQKIENITTKECPYCKNTIPIEATRCGFCTSKLTNRKEHEEEATVEE